MKNSEAGGLKFLYGNSAGQGRRHAKLAIALTALPLVLGLMAGCTPREAGKIIDSLPLAPVTLNEAEVIRLANALSWKRNISGNEARAIINKV